MSTRMWWGFWGKCSGMNQLEASTLQNTLLHRNATLVRDCAALELALIKATIPALLDPYRLKMIDMCRMFRGEAETNLALLGLNSDSLLEDVLSKTRVATYYLRLLSSRLASPVVRGGESDQLCLKIIGWMHQTHPDTIALPAAFADGDVAVWPFMAVAPVYFFPSLEQSGLLYQPLHFHEFGHGLYVLHKQEMDALVKEIQQAVGDALAPLSQRNDRHAKVQAARSEVVLRRWFDWAQEFFCDAVGLMIGGAAYLYAFSSYCSRLDQGDFYLPESDLERSRHPLIWLRIRFLVQRAKELGLVDAANRVEAEWDVIAHVLKITEDHHGYYEASMADDIHRILGDMLIEASPRQFLAEEISADREALASDTPVHLLNRAWQIQHANPNVYPDWEAQAIRAYL